MAIDHAVPRGTVTAQLSFYQPPADGSAPYNNVDGVARGLPDRNYGDNWQPVTIQDARGREDAFSLDHDAFQIVRHVQPSAETAFAEDASIQAKYYPEVEKLLLDTIPGANRVFLFDHTVRRADPSASRKPVTRTHIDQTAVSAAMRVRRHMGDDAEALLRGRYRIVNVWRPLNRGPVESFPLAFASSSTLCARDVISVEHHYESGYNGYTAAIQHDPEQKWYYLSGMTGDERLLLECFDSEVLKLGDQATLGKLAHTAFEHPGTLPGAEGRESIEVRALVFGN